MKEFSELIKNSDTFLWILFIDRVVYFYDITIILKNKANSECVSVPCTKFGTSCFKCCFFH